MINTYGARVGGHAHNPTAYEYSAAVR